MTPVQPRPAFDKFVPGQGFVADNDKARQHFTEATVTAGIVRWNSNGQIPPSDVLEQWAGLKLPFDFAKSTEARDADTAKFLKEYRAKPRRVSSEERYEMRAAFGRGKRVVNIFTGRVTRT